MRERRAWFLIHRWLGIGLGLWFALVGLTGSVLVYEDALDAWLNPALLVTGERGPALAPEAIVARALQVPEFRHVERIRLPQADGEVYRLLVRTQSRRVAVDRVEAFFSPVTGTLLGTRGAETLGLAAPHLIKTVYEFHRNVLLGNTGSNIVGIAGFLLLANAVTGLVIALPRKLAGLRRLVWINLRASATRICFDAHRSVGALFVALLILATVTGSTLVWLNYVRDLVSVFSKVAPFPTVPWRGASMDGAITLGQVVDTVQRAYPRHRVREIRVPAGQLSGYQFYLHAPGDIFRLGDTILWVHPQTAEILVERSDRTRNRGETLMHWFYPLHSGSAFGSGGMLAMCLTGATPILLVLTGLWVWLRKRRGERLGERRRAARQGTAAGAVAPALGPRAGH